MIVYDRLLELTPELGITNPKTGIFSERIILKIGKNVRDLQALKHEMVFHQNQGRGILLRSDHPIVKRTDTQHWAFCVKDVVTFFWRSGENEITCFQELHWTQELCQYWLLHTLLPLYFTIEETYYIFHAGAVETDDKLILFTADSCGGKSTLTDFFLKQGHALVSDDKVATYDQDGLIYATPSYPFHRPYREVEDLGYAVRNFAKTPRPIHAIYKLEPVEANANIHISEQQGIEKFKSLRCSSEINLCFMKKKRFSYLALMASRVPLFNIRVPRKMERLPEVYEQIRSHIAIVEGR